MGHLIQFQNNKNENCDIGTKIFLINEEEVTQEVNR